MEVIYRAIDGTEFNNESECINYEKNLEFKDTMNGIIMVTFMFDDTEPVYFDHDVIMSDTSIKSIYDNLIKCNAIYCPTYKTRDALIKFCNFYGLIGSNEMGTGWNVYNEDIEEYIPFTNIENIQEYYQDDRIIDVLKKRFDDIYRDYY